MTTQTNIMSLDLKQPLICFLLGFPYKVNIKQSLWQLFVNMFEVVVCRLLMMFLLKEFFIVT